MGPELTPDDREMLLRVARLSLERTLRRAPPVNLSLPTLRRGAFVTLWAGEELRGCLGHVGDDRPLGELVAGLVVAAAREDPRFPPVSADEVDKVRIEISVLTRAVPVDPQVVGSIVIGRDGLIVERGEAHGLLLPQVAPEHRWDAAQFLDAACEKAGLPAGAWREPGTRVLTFQADIFEEE